MTALKDADLCLGKPVLVTGDQDDVNFNATPGIIVGYDATHYLIQFNKRDIHPDEQCELHDGYPRDTDEEQGYYIPKHLPESCWYVAPSKITFINMEQTKAEI